MAYFRQMRQQAEAFPNTYLPETDISHVFHTPNAFILEHVDLPPVHIPDSC